MANSELKLYYLDGKGRAEGSRLILTAAGKKFQDIRFPYNSWPEYKPLAPFGQCPFLEVDGQIFAESLAIKTFLAREFGFHGKTNLESLEIDQIAQLVEDVSQICGKAMFEGDDAQKEIAIAKVKAEDSPRYLRYFENLLKKNDTGFFVGNRMTFAEILLLDFATGVFENIVDINDNYPLLRKNVETTKAHSKIGPYLASRPVTPF